MDEKIETLLKKLTPGEKATLLAGADMWHTRPVNRVGIPAIKLTDGPHGARGVHRRDGPKSLCFPVGTAMGATWNPELIGRLGGALAEEAKSKGAHMLLGPTVNIHRTPIAGRNFECFSEDPFLSGTLAAAYIIGLQSKGVAACIKHFICNDQEFERQSISAEVGQRPLHEIYLEPFRIAIEQAHPRGVMSAYNRLNGTYASENDALLQDLLKQKWQFDGVIISDWNGTYSDNVPRSGLDLEMPGPARWMNPEKIQDAIKAGKLDEAHIDDKVRRLLRLISWAGAFDNPEIRPEQSIDKPEHRQLARQIAGESIVMLKNDNELLPLDLAHAASIAVIGENAEIAQIMGGGSSIVNPHYAISPLAGIRARVGQQSMVKYEIGCYTHRMIPEMNMEWVRTPDGRSPGFLVEFFNNLDLVGAPIHSKVINKAHFIPAGPTYQNLDLSGASLRLSGTLTVPVSKYYDLHLTAAGRIRLWLDEELQIENWNHPSGNLNIEGSARVELSAEYPYKIIIESSLAAGLKSPLLRLGCIPVMPKDSIQRAVDLAAESELAVVVAGLTSEWESEGFDRLDMSLPLQQNELIDHVASANPNTIVVLNCGSPVDMPWLDNVPAVLQLWYGGQEMGNALADVLFGDVNPSGRLPTTFPKRLQDNPAYINYPGENGRVRYGEGIFVGYRYYDKKEISPLFPFGHGLSYTTFSYDKLRFDVDNIGSGDDIQVSLNVTNTGDRAGQEVVQLYLEEVEPRVIRPPRELKAFAKITLDPGETMVVFLKLDWQSFAFYDEVKEEWAVEPGEFTVHVGRSSRDLRLRGQFSWTGDKKLSED